MVETVFEKIGAPLKNKAENIIYQILRDRYTQKDFDRITEFNFPNFSWENSLDSGNSTLQPDYICKTSSLRPDYPQSLRKGTSPPASVPRNLFQADELGFCSNEVLGVDQTQGSLVKERIYGVQTSIANASECDLEAVCAMVDHQSYIDYLEWLLIQTDRQRNIFRHRRIIIQWTKSAIGF